MGSVREPVQIGTLPAHPQLGCRAESRSQAVVAADGRLRCDPSPMRPMTDAERPERRATSSSRSRRATRMARSVAPTWTQIHGHDDAVGRLSTSDPTHPSLIRAAGRRPNVIAVGVKGSSRRDRPGPLVQVSTT